MTSEAKRKLLRAMPLFSGMSEKTEGMLGALPCETVPAGTELSPADQPIRMGVVLSGRVSIYGKDGKGSVLLNRIGRGDVFGAAGVFAPGTDTISHVIAQTQAQILFLDRALLETILRDDFSVASAYITLLSSKIYFLNRKIISFTAARSDVALAEHLLACADETGRLPVNMSRLASQLDVGRTTLYRAVDALTVGGAIRYDGREIVILNRALLKSKTKNK